MFLWSNKESIYVKQASDIINSIFGVFTIIFALQGDKKSKQAGAGAVPSSVQLSAKLSNMLIRSVWMSCCCAELMKSIIFK